MRAFSGVPDGAPPRAVPAKHATRNPANCLPHGASASDCGNGAPVRMTLSVSWSSAILIGESCTAASSSSSATASCPAQSCDASKRGSIFSSCGTVSHVGLYLMKSLHAVREQPDECAGDVSIHARAEVHDW